MARRFDSLRSGEGMSTEGREQFSNQVSFVFNYSDIEATTRTVKKELADLAAELSKTMRDMKGNKAGYVTPAVDTYSMYSKGMDGKFSNMFTVLPDGRQIAGDMERFAIAISAESKETMKKYIGSRVDTGLMKGSVYGRTKKSAGKVSANAGWLDTWHKYFGFQEDGTRTEDGRVAIRAMRSVMRTYLEIAPIVTKNLNDYFRNYTRKGGFK